MRAVWLSFIVRVVAAGLALVALRAWLGASYPELSVWVVSPAAFMAVRLAGDAITLLLFRQALVLFYEDLLWELVAFAALGLLTAGLIVLVERFIGGPVGPYLPAITIYGTYSFAEARQAVRRRQD